MTIPFWRLPPPDLVGREGTIDDVAFDHMRDRLRRVGGWLHDLERVRGVRHPAIMGRVVDHRRGDEVWSQIRIEERESVLNLGFVVGGVKASLMLRFPCAPADDADLGPDAPGAIVAAFDAALAVARPRLLTNVSTIQDPEEAATHAPYRNAIAAVATAIAVARPELTRDVVVRIAASAAGLPGSVVDSSGRALLRAPVERRLLADLPSAAVVSSPVPYQMALDRVVFAGSRNLIGPHDAVSTMRAVARHPLAREEDALMPSTLRAL